MTSDEPFGVPLPEAVDRPARFGPFPSGHDALKFAAVAAVGAAVADATLPLLWLPFLGAGFALGVVQVEGRSLDTRVAAFARWKLRPVGPSRRSRPPGRDDRGGVIGGPGGTRLAILTTGGLPTAFLPRPEAEALFRGFRGLLDGHGHGLYLHVTSRPVDGRTFRPVAAPGRDGPERAARTGYDDLLRLLTERRRTRRVDLVEWSAGDEPDGLARLEDRVVALQGSLVALGLPVERLEGAALADARAAIGWEAPGGR